TFDGIVMNWANGTANTIMDSAIKIDNAETTAATMTDGLIITSSGVADGITDAIDVSAANLNNAVNIGANFFLMDGVRVFEGTTGTMTIEDTSGNDLLTVVDAGTVGTLNATGQIVSSNLGVEFTESDTNPTCAAGNYNIYADTSETKVKVCENGTVHDIAPITENTYTTNSTYTKPSDAIIVFVKTIGAGGGGGGGARGNNAAGGGGTGGGGGAYVEKYFDASDLASTVEVTIGTGGTAGTGSTTNNTAGGAGGVGGPTCFSTTSNCGGTIYQRAFGGGAGRAGQIALSVSGGAGGGGESSAGNAGSTSNQAGGGPLPSSANASAGGGGGGTINAAGGGNAQFGGGGGGGTSTTTSGGGGGSLRGGGGGGAGANGPNRAGGNGGLAGAYTSNTGAAGGNATGTAGTAGTNGNSTKSGGGGGGGGVAAGAGNVGGNGGAMGGGGGGGAGAGATGQNGGNGGAGGRGEVRVWTIKGTGADLAEIYSTTDASIMPGDVVSIDPTIRAGVKKSTTPYDPNAIGIISTSPSIVMGSIEEPGANPAVVALAGRVPVKVSIENGEIKPGDLLTSSSTPGVAMRATKAGQIVAQAITGYAGGLEELPVVQAFIKTDYGNGGGIASLIPGLDLDVDPEAPVTPEDPLLVEVPVPEVDISTQALQYFMSQKEILGAQLDLSEISADRISAALEIITPRVLADTVQTDTLMPATGSSMRLALSENGSFVIEGPLAQTGDTDLDADPNAEPIVAESVITFDAAGNATFKGTVTADAISANSITGLDIYAERIATLSDAVDELSSDETVTPEDLVNVRDMVAMVSSYTTSLAGEAAGNDATLLARIDSDQAAQVIVNNSLIAGLAALDLRVTATETALLANTETMADVVNRLTAVESDPGLNLAGLDLTQDLAVQGLATFSGGVMVDTIGSMGSAITFLNDLVFIGKPYFNEDTGGFAVIHAGASRVRVNFTEAYLEQPVVQASVTFDAVDTNGLDEATRQALAADLAATQAAYLSGDIRYVITEKSETGFTIVLSQPATVDLHFSWIALAIKGAGLDESLIEAPPAVVEPPMPPTGEDPYDFTTPDNLNPDYAPLEDNVPSEAAPEPEVTIDPVVVPDVTEVVPPVDTGVVVEIEPVPTESVPTEPVPTEPEPPVTEVTVIP
ncbi:MAG: hypothetical protein QG626_377, partial [Patescibacteria group bacterium]|nr:hypothetical protein [Patescibacteria group bacterium]